MPKVFALFTAGAMASLALPGMSGFASELSVFMGLTTSDVYSSTFRSVTVLLAAVGVILTPIYLLSMLRQVFYGSGAAPTCTLDNRQPMLGTEPQGAQGAVCFGTNCVLPVDATFRDASPREVFIAVSFLALIVAGGLYPKLATQLYDAKTVALNTRMRQAQVQVAQAKTSLQAQVVAAPEVAEASSVALAEIVD
jgi:NAD(P)H-quinone oxidoreductase subunit 4